MEKLLKAPGITEIICDVAKFKDITVPDGDFRDKKLILDALTEDASGTASRNEVISFATADKYDPATTDLIQLTTGEDTSLGGVTLKEQQMDIVLRLLGINSVKRLEILKKANVSIITGYQFARLVMEVMGYKEADGTTISTAVQIFAKLACSAEINFLSGSGGSSVVITRDMLKNVLLHNQSGSSISVEVDKFRIPINSGGPPPTEVDILYYLNSRTQNLQPYANKEIPTASSSVTGSAIIMGQKLRNSVLRGVFVDSMLQTVPGSITWIQPDTTVIQGQAYAWIFIPQDTNRYNIVTGNLTVNIKEASQLITEAVTLVKSTAILPLSQESKTSVDKARTAINSVIKNVVAAINPEIEVNTIYIDREFVTELSIGGSTDTVTVTNLFFDQQDTSLMLRPNVEQYVAAVSGSTVTVVSGTSISQLYSAVTVKNEFAILILPDQYPEDPSVPVTAAMLIDVIAEDNTTRKLYTIIIQ